jgi:IS30 family transposase
MLYRHLTLDQRYQIAYLFSGRISKKSIAETIGCHPSTVTRELRRNRTEKPYAGSIAHGQAKQRRRLASSRPHVSDFIYRHMVERLTAKQSPDQISGRLELLGGETVSRTTVYRHAWALNLRHNLRHTKRRRGVGNRWPKRFSKLRSIHDRAPEVAARSRLGDWEADTVRPASGIGVLVTLIERRSGLARLAWSPNGTAKAVTKCIVRAFGRMAEPVHTLTCDRGSEFSLANDLEKKLGTLVYFADARSPWQRGSVENFNGLLRQYFPRSFDFSRITRSQLRAVETELNDRPRMRLNYWSPTEVFFNQQIALQS